jgi:4-hydroxy-4-methyl-2-oxoglutarate aldolase
VARELSYPIYSSGSYMRTGKDRVEVAETGGRVSLNSVQVAPGDLVVGDDDGIVVVPKHRMADVWAVVSQVSSAEHAIREEVSAGATITEARARHGYHRLQTRSN